MSDIGQKLINEVRTIAAADPGFVYEQPTDEGCVYVHNGQPSCLIGHALWRLGYIDAGFEHYDGAGVNHNWDQASQIFDHLGLELDSQEVEWLSDVQSCQDDGQPWGRIVGIS